MAARSVRNLDLVLRVQDKNATRQIQNTKNQVLSLTKATTALAGIFTTLASIKFFHSAFKEARALEEQMKVIQGLAGFSTSEFEKFERQTRELARGIGSLTALDLAKIEKTAVVMGVAKDQLIEFSESVGYGSIALSSFQRDTTLLSTHLAKQMKIFGLGAENVNAMMSSMALLETTTAASALQISEFNQQLAAHAKIMNLSQAEASAWGATLIATGMQASKAARQVRSSYNVFIQHMTADKNNSLDAAVRVFSSAVDGGAESVERLEKLTGQTVQEMGGLRNAIKVSLGISAAETFKAINISMGKMTSETQRGQEALILYGAVGANTQRVLAQNTEELEQKISESTAAFEKATKIQEIYDVIASSNSEIIKVFSSIINDIALQIGGPLLTAYAQLVKLSFIPLSTQLSDWLQDSIRVQTFLKVELPAAAEDTARAINALATGFQVLIKLGWILGDSFYQVFTILTKNLEGTYPLFDVIAQNLRVFADLILNLQENPFDKWIHSSQYIKFVFGTIIPRAITISINAIGKLIDAILPLGSDNLIIEPWVHTFKRLNLLLQRTSIIFNTVFKADVLTPVANTFNYLFKYAILFTKTLETASRALVDIKTHFITLVLAGDRFSQATAFGKLQKDFHNVSNVFQTFSTFISPITASIETMTSSLYDVAYALDYIAEVGWRRSVFPEFVRQIDITVRHLAWFDRNLKHAVGTIGAISRMILEVWKQSTYLVIARDLLREFNVIFQELTGIDLSGFLQPFGQLATEFRGQTLIDSLHNLSTYLQDLLKNLADEAKGHPLEPIARIIQDYVSFRIQTYENLVTGSLEALGRLFSGDISGAFYVALETIGTHIEFMIERWSYPLRAIIPQIAEAQTRIGRGVKQIIIGLGNELFEFLQLIEPTYDTLISNTGLFLGDLVLGIEGFEQHLAEILNHILLLVSSIFGYELKAIVTQSVLGMAEIWDALAGFLYAPIERASPRIAKAFKSFTDQISKAWRQITETVVAQFDTKRLEKLIAGILKLGANLVGIFTRTKETLYDTDIAYLNLFSGANSRLEKIVWILTRIVNAHIRWYERGVRLLNYLFAIKQFFNDIGDRVRPIVEGFLLASGIAFGLAVILDKNASAIDRMRTGILTVTELMERSLLTVVENLFNSFRKGIPLFLDGLYKAFDTLGKTIIFFLHDIRERFEDTFIGLLADSILVWLIPQLKKANTIVAKWLSILEPKLYSLTEKVQPIIEHMVTATTAAVRFALAITSAGSVFDRVKALTGAIVGLVDNAFIKIQSLAKGTIFEGLINGIVNYVRMQVQVVKDLLLLISSFVKNILEGDFLGAFQNAMGALKVLMVREIDKIAFSLSGIFNVLGLDTLIEPIHAVANSIKGLISSLVEEITQIMSKFGLETKGVFLDTSELLLYGLAGLIDQIAIAVKHVTPIISSLITLVQAARAAVDLKIEEEPLTIAFEKQRELLGLYGQDGGANFIDRMLIVFSTRMPELTQKWEDWFTLTFEGGRLDQIGTRIIDLWDTVFERFGAVGDTTNAFAMMGLIIDAILLSFGKVYNIIFEIIEGIPLIGTQISTAGFIIGKIASMIYQGWKNIIIFIWAFPEALKEIGYWMDVVYNALFTWRKNFRNIGWAGIMLPLRALGDMLLYVGKLALDTWTVISLLASFGGTGAIAGAARGIAGGLRGVWGLIDDLFLSIFRSRDTIVKTVSVIGDDIISMTEKTTKGITTITRSVRTAITEVDDFGNLIGKHYQTTTEFFNLGRFASFWRRLETLFSTNIPVETWVQSLRSGISNIPNLLQSLWSWITDFFRFMGAGEGIRSLLQAMQTGLRSVFTQISPWIRNLWDNIYIYLDDLYNSTIDDIFLRLRQAISSLWDELLNLFSGPSIFSRITARLRSFGNVFDIFDDLGLRLVANLRTIGNTLDDIGRNLVNRLEYFINAFDDFAETALLRLRNYWNNLQGTITFGSLLDDLHNQWRLFADFLGTRFAQIPALWNRIRFNPLRSLIDDMLTGIRTFTRQSAQVIDDLARPFITFFQSLPARISEAWTNIRIIAPPWLDDISRAIFNWYETLMIRLMEFGDDIQAMINLWRIYFSLDIPFLDRLRRSLNLLSRYLNDNANISQVLHGVWETIRQSTVWQTMARWIRAVRLELAPLINIFKKVWDWITKIGLASHEESVWPEMFSWIQKVTQITAPLIQALNKITTVFVELGEKIPQSLQSTATEIKNALISPFIDAFEFILSKWNQFVSQFKFSPKSLLKGITNMFSLNEENTFEKNLGESLSGKMPVINKLSTAFNTLRESIQGADDVLFKHSFGTNLERTKEIISDTTEAINPLNFSFSLMQEQIVQTDEQVQQYSGLLIDVAKKTVTVTTRFSKAAEESGLITENVQENIKSFKELGTTVKETLETIANGSSAAADAIQGNTEKINLMTKGRIDRGLEALGSMRTSGEAIADIIQKRGIPEMQKILDRYTDEEALKLAFGRLTDTSNQYVSSILQGRLETAKLLEQADLAKYAEDFTKVYLAARVIRSGIQQGMLPLEEIRETNPELAIMLEHFQAFAYAAKDFGAVLSDKPTRSMHEFASQSKKSLLELKDSFNDVIEDADRWDQTVRASRGTFEALGLSTADLTLNAPALREVVTDSIKAVTDATYNGQDALKVLTEQTQTVTYAYTELETQMFSAQEQFREAMAAKMEQFRAEGNQAVNELSYLNKAFEGTQAYGLSLQGNLPEQVEAIKAIVSDLSEFNLHQQRTQFVELVDIAQDTADKMKEIAMDETEAYEIRKNAYGKAYESEKEIMKARQQLFTHDSEIFKTHVEQELKWINALEDTTKKWLFEQTNMEQAIRAAGIELNEYSLEALNMAKTEYEATEALNKKIEAINKLAPSLEKAKEASESTSTAIEKTSAVIESAADATEVSANQMVQIITSTVQSVDDISDFILQTQQKLDQTADASTKTASSVVDETSKRIKEETRLFQQLSSETQDWLIQQKNIEQALKKSGIAYNQYTLAAFDQFKTDKLATNALDAKKNALESVAQVTEDSIKSATGLNNITQAEEVVKQAVATESVVSISPRDRGLQQQGHSEIANLTSAMQQLRSTIQQFIGSLGNRGTAPRFHSGGLASDEIPAILQTGEYVLSRRHISQMKQDPILLDWLKNYGVRLHSGGMIPRFHEGGGIPHSHDEPFNLIVLDPAAGKGLDQALDKAKEIRGVVEDINDVPLFTIDEERGHTADEAIQQAYEYGHAVRDYTGWQQESLNILNEMTELEQRKKHFTKTGETVIEQSMVAIGHSTGQTLTAYTELESTIEQTNKTSTARAQQAISTNNDMRKAIEETADSYRLVHDEMVSANEATEVSVENLQSFGNKLDFIRWAAGEARSQLHDPFFSQNISGQGSTQSADYQRQLEALEQIQREGLPTDSEQTIAIRSKIEEMVSAQKGLNYLTNTKVISELLQLRGLLKESLIVDKEALKTEQTRSAGGFRSKADFTEIQAGNFISRQAGMTIEKGAFGGGNTVTVNMTSSGQDDKKLARLVGNEVESALNKSAQFVQSRVIM